MTKRIFYEKVGRKYVPVYEYDQVLMDAFPQGNHLVMCYPGGQSRRYHIDPAYAPLIAAARVAEDVLSDAIYKAAAMHREEHENFVLTNEQLAAWHHFVHVMGERGRYVKYNSVRDIADAGIKALIDEASKLLENPSVKLAYEHFLLVAELSKATDNT